MSLRGLTVGVIFGSRSVEHEISVITACQVMGVLGELGARAVPLYVTKQGRWLTHTSFSELATFRERLPEEGEPVQLDLARGEFRTAATGLLSKARALELDALIPLTHGTFGEDGCLAGLAAMARVPQVGSDTLAAALAMDKVRSKLVFQAMGLPVVEARLVDASSAERAATEIGYPLVVKPNRGGSSIGVGLAQSPAELEDAVELAESFDSQLVLEPAVPGAQDLNCAVKSLAPRFSVVERPLKGEGVLSYSDKYQTKGSLAPAKEVVAGSSPKGGRADPRRELPAQIPDELRSRVQELAVTAYDALGCSGTARVDFLLADSGELYLNEVNTIPGSLAFYLWEASGLGFAALVEELVREALQFSERRQLALPGNLLSQRALGK